MSRNISDLHPKLQELACNLVEECFKQGIKIKIGECLRTEREQNDLFAKGRSLPGAVVTNAPGSLYSSMHQWGVAFDFYLVMDVDKDGKTFDDSFNNNTKLFNRVGQIGKSLGLEWGGDWKSIKDLPHFQLPNWGSTTAILKKKYSYPEKFMDTWNDTEIKVKAKKKTYLVQRGDCLTSIAKKYNTTVDKLVKINKLKSSLVHTGQVLKIN